MLLTIEKGVRTGICHPISRYVKPSNKWLQ